MKNFGKKVRVECDFGKGFDIGLKNIAIGDTQEEIDKMVNALKDGEHFIRGRGRERFEKQ